MQNKKVVTLVVSLLIFCCSFLVWMYQSDLSWWWFGVEPTVAPVERIEQPEDQREPWMTVFVHGTFATTFGMFNIIDTLHDKVRGTLYPRITKKMRSNPFFYADQPIQDRGLIPLDPTYDISSSPDNKLAAFPLVQAFKDMHELLNPGKEHHYFYTFGWSGLLSQKVRRHESIRLFNALALELDRFAAQGITPKIRLISHSHGGNVILNMALINEILSYGISSVPVKDKITHANKHGALRRMYETLTSLPSQDQAEALTGNKRWDYQPATSREIRIDETIFLGCPIQPETEHCIDPRTFKRLYHLYSQEDKVQTSDWISTQRYGSGQLFSPEYASVMRSESGSTRLVQVQLMQRNLDEPDEQSVTWYGRVWNKLVDSLSFFIRKTKDPTHKELWFITWNDEIEEPTLTPLPTMILVPLIKQLTSQIPDNDHFAINIEYGEQMLKLVAINSETKEVIASEHIPAQFIRDIKENVLKWRPDDYSPQTRFEVLSQYTKEALS